MKQRIWWIGLCAIGVLAIWFLNVSGLFAGPEQLFEDIVLPVRSVPASVVVVAIDDESISRIGQWPWKREVFATVLSNMKAHAPAAVGIDVLFAEESRFGQGDDAVLSGVLRGISYPVVFPVQFGRLGVVSGSAVSGSHAVFSDSIVPGPSTTLGHVNLIVDRDGVVRRFPSRIRASDAMYASLGEQTVAVSGFSVSEAPSFSPLEPIVFSGKPGAVPVVPFYRLYEGDQTALSAISGKIVFVGSTASSLHDTQQVPVGGGVAMAGAEIQAHIANMVLSGYRQHGVSFLTMFSILLAVGVTAFCVAFFFDLAVALLLFSVLIIGEVVLFILFAQQGILYNILHTVFVTSSVFLLVKGYKYVVVDRRGRQMKKIFSKYVSGTVLDTIMQNPDAVKLGGEEREMTVFFSDIRGFTTISERTTPTELVRILNEYFTAMTSEVLRTGGVVDKYIGDAIMAFWGAPAHDPDHADHAMDAALAMIEKLKILNKKLRAQGDPEIAIGIGLYTGRAVVGNVGSNDRFDYTVIGDTVNAASRLEGLNKEYKTQIIISETVKAKLKKEYDLVCLGSSKVKGRTEPINIYTVAGTQMPVTDDVNEDAHKHH